MEKVALITGGCKGIGRAMALTFAKAGYNLVLLSRKDSSACQETVEEAKAFGKDVLFLEADVSKEEEVKEAFQHMLEKYGHIDVLINNAGIVKDGLALRMSSEDFQDVLNINLLGSFYCAKEALRSMSRKRSGIILNISSVVGIYGNPGQSNYAASKAGMIGLTKTLAKEFGSRNIRVNAIAPGFIESDMTESLSDAVKEEAMKKLSIKRFGTAEEVAELALFLASEKAEYITGQVLSIDGGIAL